MVVTADASMVTDAQSDDELKQIIQSAALVTPDSTGILWASKKKGSPLTEKVSGVELVDKICELSALKGYRIAFMGAEPGIAEMAAEKLRLRYPGTNIVGAQHGYFPASDDSIIAEELALLKPDVLFVAMGIPRQEKFIFNTQQIIQAKVAIGVGGSLDVFSGKTKRAPVIFQKLRVEWFWRLILNPSKWRKTMKLPQFIGIVNRDKS